MKKILLSLLILTAITTSAQTSTTIIPEIKTGWASIDLDGNISTVDFSAYITIGIAKKSNNGESITGLVIGRSDYGHLERHANEWDENEGLTTSVGCWLVGAQYIHRQNNGLIFGGLVGYSIFDEEYKIFYGDEDSDSYITVNKGKNETIYGLDDYDIYNTPSRRGIAVKGKVGYGWNSVYLMIEAGYCKGPEIGLNVAFPLFKKYN